MSIPDCPNNRSDSSEDMSCPGHTSPSKEQRLHDLMASARWQALRLHKLFGNPVPVSRDGKVIWIQPEDIEIPEEELAKPMRLPAIY